LIILHWRHPRIRWLARTGWLSPTLYVALDLADLPSLQAA
jgi:hypothetical protein